MLKQASCSHCPCVCCFLTAVFGRWSLPHKIFTWIIALFFLWRLSTFAFGFTRLLEIKRFYEHLLDIPNVCSLRLSRLRHLTRPSIASLTFRR